MKATGIVRRIDDLGRVVVPKEIRRTLRIREGDPLEIFTNREGGIILKKYSPIGELGELAAEYVEAVAQVSKCTVCVADRDMIVAVAGPAKREFHGQNIHAEFFARVDLDKRFARPLFGNGDLEDRILIVDVDKIDDIRRIDAHGEFFRHVAVGINHLVRPRAREELALNIGRRLGNDSLCAQIL